MAESPAGRESATVVYRKRVIPDVFRNCFPVFTAQVKDDEPDRSSGAIRFVGFPPCSDYKKGKQQK